MTSPSPTPSGDPGLLTLLREWVPAQRWYANKGHPAILTELGSWTAPAADASIRVHLLLDEGADEPVLFQVPVSTRSAPLPGADDALIGTDGRNYHYDAPHDPAFTAALLNLMLDETDTGDSAVRGTALDRPAATRVSGSRVLRGEQSNTSIIFDLVDEAGRPGTPLIGKLFRVLHPGENPDVAVQSALAAVGSAYVPKPVGYLTGRWRSPGGAPVTGHLAFLQEFLPGVQDAWRVALRSAAAGEDFTHRSRALGVATASVHADLARTFPTASATPEAIGAIVEDMRERYRIALKEVPALAEHEDAVEAVFAAAERQDWPRLQRIHGDYHLGQVLDAPGRGWMLIDFEGEPLRPMSERGRPDVALRDLAGMLRSISYVAGSVTVALHGRENGGAVDAWAQATRDALLDGYERTSGQDLGQQRWLLDALELDKAIYETRYETRNRPDWLRIPLAGVQRLVGA